MLHQFTLVFIGLCLLFAAHDSHAVSEQSLPIADGERLLILAPHPDDESLSAAGLIHRVLEKHGSVRTVVVTAGDAYVEAVQHETGKSHPTASDYLEYGEMRLEESRRAARILGKNFIHMDMLGFSDGAIYPMLVSNWQRRHPDKSPFTHASRVPYPDAEAKGVAQAGQELRNELLAIMQESKPTLIVFPDVMENDSDHAGLGMFGLLAVHDWLANSNGTIDSPRLLAYLIHWQNGWPSGSNLDTPIDLSDQPLYLPTNLPLRGHTRSCLNLSKQEIDLKREALAQYQTQQQAMAPFLSAFIRSTECFSLLAPADSNGVSSIVKHWQQLRKVFDDQPFYRKSIATFRPRKNHHAG